MAKKLKMTKRCGLQEDVRRRTKERGKTSFIGILRILLHLLRERKGERERVRDREREKEHERERETCVQYTHFLYNKQKARIHEDSI